MPRQGFILLTGKESCRRNQAWLLKNSIAQPLGEKTLVTVEKCFGNQVSRNGKEKARG
jgi:hypothetical protein